MKRPYLAFLLAPLVPGIVAGAIDLMTGMITALLGYVCMGLFGLPTYWLLNETGRLTFPSCMLSGVVIGVLGFHLFAIVAFSNLPLDASWDQWVSESRRVVSAVFREPNILWLPVLLGGAGARLSGIS